MCVSVCVCVCMCVCVCGLFQFVLMQVTVFAADAPAAWRCEGNRSAQGQRAAVLCGGHLALAVRGCPAQLLVWNPAYGVVLVRAAFPLLPHASWLSAVCPVMFAAAGSTCDC